MNLYSVQQDIVIPKGADFGIGFSVLRSDSEPLNISGATAAAKLADGPGGNHLYNFTCTIPVGTDGLVVVTAPASDTAGFTFFSGWWSMNVTLVSGQVLRVVAGQATLDYGAP